MINILYLILQIVLTDDFVKKVMYLLKMIVERRRTGEGGRNREVEEELFTYWLIIETSAGAMTRPWTRNSMQISHVDGENSSPWSPSTASQMHYWEASVEEEYLEF